MSDPDHTRAPSTKPEAAKSAVAGLQCRIPPPDTREEALYRCFVELGIVWTTHVHAPVFTVEEARHLRGTLPGTHTKNLFLTEKKGGFWLRAAREDVRVDLNALAKTLGRPRFSFGAPELLVEMLGIMPGAVSPFALMNDTKHRIRAVFDMGMLVLDPINFHPLRNDRTTAIAAADLLRFSHATGHEPLITTLPERPGSA
jgi:Ala-tRNA(Pro) deacylase